MLIGKMLLYRDRVLFYTLLPRVLCPFTPATQAVLVSVLRPLSRCSQFSCTKLFEVVKDVTRKGAFFESIKVFELLYAK